MSFLAEQGSDAVFSDAHRSARVTLTAKIEIEATKTLAKARLEAAGDKERRRRGAGASWRRATSSQSDRSSAAWTSRYVASVEEGRPLCRKVALKADQWGSVLGESEYLTRAIRFGVRDMPTVPFTAGRILPEIPQTEEDRAFARFDLKKGTR